MEVAFKKSSLRNYTVPMEIETITKHGNMEIYELKVIKYTGTRKNYWKVMFPLGSTWKHSDDFNFIDPPMQTWGSMFKKSRNNDSLMYLKNFSVY